MFIVALIDIIESMHVIFREREKHELSHSMLNYLCHMMLYFFPEEEDLWLWLNLQVDKPFVLLRNADIRGLVVGCLKGPNFS